MTGGDHPEGKEKETKSEKEIRNLFMQGQTDNDEEILSKKHKKENLYLDGHLLDLQQ